MRRLKEVTYGCGLEAGLPGFESLLALQLASFVTLGKLPNVSLPQLLSSSKGSSEWAHWSHVVKIRISMSSAWCGDMLKD